MFFGVGDSCHFSYSSVSHLFESCGGMIASVREERANFSATIYL